MRANFAIFLTICFLPLIVACQTGSQSNGKPEVVSLEKAKQVTATFERSSFTPPPPNIEDITAVLDKEKPDPTVARKARAEADKPIPKGLTGTELAAFLYERSLAASKIGRLKQRLKDIRKTVDIAEKRGGPLGRYLQELSFAEDNAGNLRNALKIVLRRAEVEEANQSRLSHGTLGRLVQSYRFIGDLVEAKKWLERLKDRNDSAVQFCAGNSEGNCRNMSAATAVRYSATAQILESEGKFEEAIELRRNTQALIDNAINKGIVTRLSKETYVDWANNSLQNSASLKLKAGRLLEAEIDSRAGLSRTLMARGKFSSQAGRHILRLQKIIFEQGRFEDAESLAGEALKILKAVGTEEDTKTLSDARAQVADSLVAQGEWKSAVGYYDKIERALQRDAVTRRSVLGDNLNHIWARYRTGGVKSGIAGAKKIHNRRRKSYGSDHYLAAEAQGFLAMGLLYDGQFSAALKEFQSAAVVLLTSSQDSVKDRSKISARDLRLGAVLDAYVELLGSAKGQDAARHANIDAVGEAFRISDFGRSRSVQSALAASGARAAASNPALAKLVREEQDTQKQIDGLFAVLRNALSAPSNQQDLKSIASLRIGIKALRASNKKLTADIAAKFPAYSELIAPKSPTPKSVRKSLASGEALISYYLTEKNAYVWAVPKNGPVAFANAPFSKEAIGEMVDDLREALDPGVGELGKIPDFNVALSHKLYKTLLAPVRRGWKNAKSLLVVSHKSMSKIPLSVLVTKPSTLPKESGALFSKYKNIPWLAKTHTVTALPSVASLVSLRARPEAAKTRRAFVGFGDPYFSVKQAAAAKQTASFQAAANMRGALMRGGRVNLRSAPKTRGVGKTELAKLPRLPDTGEEVVSVAKALKANQKRDVFLGTRATEEAVKQANLSDYKVVHFATHGLVPLDLNGLTQPALALSSPKLTGGSREDGLLTMGEILTLQLDADWVVLSACNTAAGEDGGEAFSGLGRAFFYAGTRAILLSNWPVETTSARALTTDLFRRQAEQKTLSRSQALQAAMVSLINGSGYIDPKSNKVVFSYAHPIFWAPFSLVGDGGGGRPGA
jgi:CHAT domain-containing protein